MLVEERDREIDMEDRTMTDSDFSPTDATGLAAWFARAEANAAGLRRRLGDLGADWQGSCSGTRAAGAGNRGWSAGNGLGR